MLAKWIKLHLVFDNDFVGGAQSQLVLMSMFGFGSYSI